MELRITANLLSKEAFKNQLSGVIRDSHQGILARQRALVSSG